MSDNIINSTQSSPGSAGEAGAGVGPLTMGSGKIRYEIEYLRTISAFGLVVYHSEIHGADVGYAGLIVFLLISIYLAGASDPKSPYHRAVRLLVPWVFWYSLYAFLKLCIGKPFWVSGESILSTVLSGGHLWYLPFAFVVLCAIDFLRKYVALRWLSFFGAGVAALILYSTPSWRIPSMGLGAPWSQYAHASAGVFAGLFLMGARNFSRTISIFLASLIVIAAVAVIDVRGVGLPYLVGFVSMAFVVMAPKSFFHGNKAPPGALLSQYSFGIYLIHPIFLAGAARLGLHQNWFVPVMAFILSALSVKAIQFLLPRYSRYIL